MAADRDEVLRGLKVYHAEGDVFEFRLPIHKSRTISGYFDDIEKAADEAVRLSKIHPDIAIYCTINPTKKELIGRANNRTKDYAKNTTADGDVTLLNWLPADADTIRPAGISSSDEGHDRSIARIRYIKKWLVEEQGWPERSLVIVDSGNGGYLLARIELENDINGTQENTKLVAGCLEALDYLFGDEAFHIDTTSQNPARILRVPGTLNAKGDEVAELAMKHRSARILDAPDSFEVVPKEKLLALVAMLPEEEAQPKTYVNTGGFDPVKYCQDHNLSVHHTKPWKGGTAAILDECIFDSSHELSACIIGWPNGKRTYRCRHNSCLSKKWADAKAKIEPFKSRLDDNAAKLGDIRKERIDQKFKSEAEPEITIDELLGMVKSDAHILEEPAIIRFMAGLRANAKIDFDLLIDSIKKARTGVTVATITGYLDEYDLENQKATASPTEPPEGISNEAQVLIDSGKGYEYIYQVWQKRVKGNEYLGKALILSRAVQSCLNSKGIHIYAHGKHGSGKSEGMEKMIELVPSEYKMDEDISPLAIHYASKNGMLIEGTTLLIDEMIWSDALGGIIKRVITRFQKGAGHLTVIDGEPVLARTQPRLAIWTNSADLQADEQLRDRFLDEPIDEGDGQVAAIIEFLKTRDTLPVSSEDIDRETAICQDIIRDIASKTFIVSVPFALRIKIAPSEGTRGYNIFSDLVKGFAILRYKQRQTNDQGQLIAIEDDFNSAKDVYEGSKGHSEQSYTTSEQKVLQAIIDHDYKATYKEIKDATGLSEGRIKDIVNGRGKDEQKRHGLRYKCPQLEVDKVDISLVTHTDSRGYADERRTVHPNELTLPNGFKVTDGTITSLVNLDPDPRRKRSIPDVTPTYPIINNKIDLDVVDVGIEIREREKDTSQLSIVDNEQSENKGISSFIPLSKQKGYVATSGCQTIVKSPSVGSGVDASASLEDSDSSIASALKTASAAAKAKEDHFKTPAKRDALKPEKVRITAKDGYRTQNPLPDNPKKFVDHLYPCGEIIEVEHWRVASLIEKGIAETVEA
jgi:hypothetical protein